MAADLPENYNRFWMLFIHQRRSNRLTESNYLEAEPDNTLLLVKRKELTTGL
jgi:hypothetical protein